VFHIIYKTIRLGTGEYYVGKHSTPNLMDGYRGSGRWVARLPKEATTTLILHSCDSEGECLRLERELVDIYRTDPLCQNQTRGGRGSFEHLRGRLKTDEENEKRSATLRATFSRWTEEQKERKRANQRGLRGPTPLLAGENNPFFGRKHTEETKLKIRAAISPEQRATNASGNTNVRGRSWFNDGKQSYLLNTDEALGRGLIPGRFEGMFWFHDGQRMYRLPQEEGVRRGLVSGKLPRKKTNGLGLAAPVEHTDEQRFAAL
jgi:hypothetical protein